MSNPIANPNNPTKEQISKLKCAGAGVLRSILRYYLLMAADDAERFVWTEIDHIPCFRYDPNAKNHRGKAYSRSAVKKVIRALVEAGVLTSARKWRRGDYHFGYVVAPFSSICKIVDGRIELSANLSLKWRSVSPMAAVATVPTTVLATVLITTKNCPGDCPESRTVEWQPMPMLSPCRGERVRLPTKRIANRYWPTSVLSPSECLFCL